MKYLKQLDSIRAIAVLLVISFHWIAKHIPGVHYNFGHLGVEIFFVLSGFLITRILLENRNEAERLLQNKKYVLKSFYVRRFLRIFPIYYLTILATFLLHEKLRLVFNNNELFASVTYTSNFYMNSTKYWPQATSHFWSLSVEEQFYLFWPLFMLFLPKRSLLVCIISFISIGIISRFSVSDVEFGFTQLNVSFDCLGMGALLAWIVVYRDKYLSQFYNLASVVGLISLVAIVCKYIGILSITQTSLFSAVFTVWIITHILVSASSKSWLSFILNNKLLINIGKVSYGLYLYHILFGYFMGRLWDKVLQKFSVSVDSDFYYYMICFINFWILLLLCWLSFKFIETPILSLKKKFKYQDKASSEKVTTDLIIEKIQAKVQ